MGNNAKEKLFFWGAATSSHQVEGDNHNDWSEWEHTHAKELSQKSGGKYPPENYISGRACDHYNRFEEDFGIAQSLGHNAHRFSIEWSRIEPEEGKFNEREIEHYRKVLRALRARDMEPFVTLWHWTLPVWLRDKGGAASKEFPRLFARYAKRMAEEYRDDVKFWITINEPMVYVTYGYVTATRPPNISNIYKASKALWQLIAAHNRAYDGMHSVSSSFSIGIAKHDKYFIASPGIINRIAAAVAAYIWNHYTRNHTVRREDFIGINYYNKNTIRFSWSAEKKGLYNLSTSSAGLYRLLISLGKYKKPIYILENGLNDAEDTYRTQFIRDHVDAMRRAIQNGVDVRGYFHWSLLDNFEWEHGFWPRFGLVGMDYKTMERRVRQSAHEYTALIKKHSPISYT